MKSSMHIKNMPVFMQILLAFLIVIVPLYALTANANHLGAKNVEQEISRTMAGQTGYYMEILESEILRILTVQTEYLKDEDLQSISAQGTNRNEAQINQSILNIEKRINHLKTLSSFVDEVMV